MAADTPIFQSFFRPPFRPNRRQFLAATAALAVPGWLASCAPASLADIVYVGGEIHTVDGSDTRVEALAVGGGKILAAGTNRALQDFIGPNTRRIDLDGRTVLPGINDSHLHLMMWGLSQPPFSIDVTYPTVKSIADVVAAVQLAATTREPGEWIVGRGWDQPYFSEGRAPTAADLDAVAPDNPVYIKPVWGYWRKRLPLVSIANSRAMELAKIDRDTVPPSDEIEIVTRLDVPRQLRQTGTCFGGSSKGYIS